MFDRRREAPATVRRRRRNSGRVESRRRRHLSGIATDLAKIAARLVQRGHEDQRRYGVAEFFLVSTPPGSSSTPSNNRSVGASQLAQPSLGLHQRTGTT